MLDLKNKTLSLIIPSYNQEKTILENIRRLYEVLELSYENFEILIVIDGQKDNTLKILKSAKLDKVKIISYAENKGKSYAIRLGMKYSKGEYVMFMDAGMEIDPQGIMMLLVHMQWYDADIIVGSKRHLASQIKYNLQRKILSYGYYYLVKFMFGVKVKDTQAGIKVFRKKVLVKILPRLVEKRFAGDLEMLVVANKLGFTKIFEAPIKLNYDLAGLSSAASLISIYHILIDTFGIFYRYKILKYYDKAHRKFVKPKDVVVYSR